MGRSILAGAFSEYPIHGIKPQTQFWDCPKPPACLDNNGVEEHDTRRAALRAWIDKHNDGNVTEFARKHGLNQSHLSEMFAGKRPIGERVARTIETKAKMPARHLEKFSGAVKEASAPYHGILLTRAGAQLGAEWEKLDIVRRAHYEQLIYGEVAQKIRTSRKSPSARRVEDDE